LYYVEYPRIIFKNIALHTSALRCPVDTHTHISACWDCGIIHDVLFSSTAAADYAVEFMHHAPAGKQLAGLEWLRVCRHSCPLPGAVERLLVPRGANRKNWRACVRHVGRQRGAMRMQMHVDKMNLESLVYFCGTGSALRPALRCRPSLEAEMKCIFQPMNAM
jgi:hypothetical protein